MILQTGNGKGKSEQKKAGGIGLMPPLVERNARWFEPG